jgi:hypothetical protein
MERFLDFEAVCRLGIVEVDARQMPHEPKGRFAGTLYAEPEFGIAEQFVEAAKYGNLRTDVKEFANYPIHSHYRRGQAKPHEDTLTYWMHMAKQAARPKAQIKQFADRGLKPSHLLVNKGDLEILFTDQAKKLRMKATKKAAAKAAKQATKKTTRAKPKKKAPVVVIDDDEENNPQAQQAIQRALQEAQEKGSPARRN